MIISRTPFRISFVGGGTDLKEFYKDIPGAVLSTSIDKYIYQSMHEYFQKGKSLIKYSSTEEVDNINQIRHNIVREVFKMFSIDNVDFNSTADIASGTGMGSSSSFTSGLIKLCSEFNNSNLTNLQIAEIACQLEIDILGEPIGKQDQYACAVGGLNLIKFYPDESVEVKSLDLNFSDIKYLEDNLILFYTGSSRSASSILAQQQQNTLNSIKTKENLKIHK
jgi:D-glycero-alpha-D-manno-heptose-7-phosphate kinase